MIFSFDAACGSFIGNGRDCNQDNFYFNKKHLPVNNSGTKKPLNYKGDTTDAVLFAVFDGLGGEAMGEVASCKASEVFSEEFKLLDELALSGKEFLCRACEKANTEVNKLSDENKVATMGTTVAALYFIQDEVFACNVGDSKIFRIRNSQMVQISEDHTDEKIMSSVGIKKKPVLLQFIGIPETEMTICPFISKGDVQSDDVYIICSDGITDIVDVKTLYDNAIDCNATDATEQIIGQVEKLNGNDNATLIVVKIK